MFNLASHMMRIFIVAVLLAAPFSAKLAALPPTDASELSTQGIHVSDKGKVYMENLLQRHAKKSSAGIVAVLIDNNKVESYAFGKKAVTGNEPVTEESVFEIGSITKVFTVTVLMDMVHKGIVQLDDPIDTYLPGVNIPQFNGKKITFRHLATHTSGLPTVPDDPAFSDITNPYKNYTAEKLYPWLSQYELKTAPGENPVYSNVGMGLLGHTLCLISKKTFEELVRESICSPLGMTNTRIRLTDEMKEKKTTGHCLEKEVEYWDFDVLCGAGALRSTAKDMTLFLLANMGLLQSPLTTVLQECHEEQIHFPGQGGMALGWQISNRGIITHMGGTGGSLSFIGFNPKNQRGLVLLSNSTEFFSDDLTIGLLDPENYIPETPVDESLTCVDYLKQFEGSFLCVGSEPNPQITINYGVYGKDLWVWMSTGEKAVLIPVTYGVFRPRGFPEGYQSRFILDSSNKVIKVQVVSPTGVLEADPLS